jgi:hypothetical protein
VGAARESGGEVIGYILLGVLLTHLFWAAVIVGWWTILIRRSDESVRQAVEDDFQAIREGIKRAKSAGRN